MELYMTEVLDVHSCKLFEQCAF